MKANDDKTTCAVGEHQTIVSVHVNACASPHMSGNESDYVYYNFEGTEKQTGGGRTNGCLVQAPLATLTSSVSCDGCGDSEHSSGRRKSCHHVEYHCENVYS